jgi:Zn-dependent protease/CBS domain-containing protein
MKRGNVIPVGRICGIPIGLDYSWFLIFALLTWLLAVSYFPHEFHDWSPMLYWVMGAITAILLFVSVLLHELGHSIVALQFKVPVRSITLFIFGGVAQIGTEPPSALAEFLIAIAGPIVSFLLAALFTFVKSFVTGIEPVWGLVKYLAWINFALVIFNCIPGFPLDGGRVFRALIWAVTKNMRRATLVAANAGRFFGFLFIFVGVWQMLAGNFGDGLWIAFIGWFLDNAASAQVHQVMFQGLLAGHTVAQAMSRQCAMVAADLTLQQLVDDHILSGGQRCFLVNRGGDTVGLMTLHAVREVPRAAWPATTVAQVMRPFDQLKRIDPDAGLWNALQLMDRDGVNQLPVMTGNQVVGMLSREDVVTFLRTLQELGA